MDLITITNKVLAIITSNDLLVLTVRIKNIKVIDEALFNNTKYGTDHSLFTKE